MTDPSFRPHWRNLLLLGDGSLGLSLKISRDSSRPPHKATALEATPRLPPAAAGLRRGERSE